MSSKQSKRLLAKVRQFKRVKTGIAVADVLYTRIKKELKDAKRKQSPKLKLSGRQQRLAKANAELSLTTTELRGRAKRRARDEAPKRKAARW